jgi:hypothetical protein
MDFGRPDVGQVDQMTADLAVEQAQRVDAEKRLAAGFPRLV